MKANIFSKAIERFESLREKMEVEIQNLFAEATKELFEKHPEMESFSWTQYTPYFNDGDECVFSVRSDDPDINGITGYEISKSWSHGEKHYPANHPELLNAKTAVEDILSSVPDEFMKGIFGDHMRVTVYRDGKIETDEYSHD